jgi:hypothetical protein
LRRDDLGVDVIAANPPFATETMGHLGGIWLSGRAGLIGHRKPLRSDDWRSSAAAAARKASRRNEIEKSWGTIIQSLRGKATPAAGAAGGCGSKVFGPGIAVTDRPPARISPVEAILTRKIELTVPTVKRRRAAATTRRGTSALARSRSYCAPEGRSKKQTFPSSPLRAESRKAEAVGETALWSGACGPVRRTLQRLSSGAGSTGIGFLT